MSRKPLGSSGLTANIDIQNFNWDLYLSNSDVRSRNINDLTKSTVYALSALDSLVDTISASQIVGGGTENYIGLWQDSNTLTASIDNPLYFNRSNGYLGLGGNVGITGDVQVEGLGTKEIKIQSDDSDSILSLRAAGDSGDSAKLDFYTLSADDNYTLIGRMYVDAVDIDRITLSGSRDLSVISVIPGVSGGYISLGDGIENFAKFEKDGTLVLSGAATVWDDLRVSLERGKVQGATIPSFEEFRTDGAGSKGVYAYNFDDGDEIWFSVQLPHSWKIGSTLYPHLHWVPESDATGDNVGIGLEYSAAGVMGIFPNTVTMERDIPGDIAFKHIINNFSTTGMDISGLGLSSVIMCRFYRYAAAANNYAGGIFALETDFHFQIDMIGSRLILTK